MADHTVTIIHRSKGPDSSAIVHRYSAGHPALCPWDIRPYSVQLLHAASPNPIGYRSFATQEEAVKDAESWAQAK